MSRAVQETPQPTMRGTEGMLAGPMSCKRVKQKEGKKKKKRGGEENMMVNNYSKELSCSCVTESNVSIMLKGFLLYYGQKTT